ncbi:hypothetical protein ACGFW5_25490 [Streptomyces sp. NPDC048416]|uniref:hypothetical protein n=1 Tax=Streptomyces sp. NPDC048416 TaxID=3365546 RepID=UPI003713D201
MVRAYPIQKTAVGMRTVVDSTDRLLTGVDPLLDLALALVQQVLPAVNQSHESHHQPLLPGRGSPR